ncbi:hypothetical protein [Hyphomonas johnsonii]|uniref:Uncharacterized protein n=1 Tax=Hyphomonas johnsonii MHS-2 TaxID=1280950 RepID=A0A059FU27_9PROT|nr:hypothetical protein [Hyphomonas johnsonii]KCZ94001.1 hypothetical protein HJO_01460 [Hyphomonas johnsonii MHS-2]
MIRIDDVELLELFQTVIVSQATPPKDETALSGSSYFLPVPTTLNQRPTRLSDLGGGASIIAAVSVQLESNGDSHLAGVMRQCERALTHPALFVDTDGESDRRLLGYVYPVV